MVKGKSKRTYMSERDYPINRIERLRKPIKCPSCGHRPVGTILWGDPDMTLQLRDLMDAGKIIIGGCCLSPDDPTWEC